MFEMYFTAAVILMMTIALIKELYRPSIILFLSLLVLCLGNVISIKEAFNGFSNHGMLTVAVLFVIAAALQSSTAFGKTMGKI